MGDDESLDDVFATWKAWELENGEEKAKQGEPQEADTSLQSIQLDHAIQPNPVIVQYTQIDQIIADSIRPTLLDSQRIFINRLANIRLPNTKFNSKQSYINFGLVFLYTTENIVGSVLQRTNPGALAPVLFNLEAYLPQIAVTAIDKFKHDESMPLDVTMYTKIIGAGIVETLQILSEHFGKQMRLEGGSEVKNIAFAIAYVAGAAFANDIIGRQIRNWQSHKPYISPINTGSDRDFRDPNQYLSWIDHAAVATFRRHSNNMTDTNANLSMAAAEAGIPVHEHIDDLRELCIHMSSILQQQRGPEVNPTELPVTDGATIKQSFYSKQTATSSALLLTFVGLNSSSAYLQRSNAGAVIPVLFNLLGYLPPLVGTAIDKYRYDEALKLDVALITKIIGGVLIQGVQLGLEYVPERLGQRKPGSVESAFALIGLVMLSSLLTDIMTRFINRISEKPRVSVLTDRQDPNRDPRNEDHHVSFIDHFVSAISNKPPPPEEATDEEEQLQLAIRNSGVNIDSKYLHLVYKNFGTLSAAVLRDQTNARTESA
jgi:hypothetical protein